MDIVKKNIVSILCGVAALAAVVVALVILPGRANELKENLEARKKAYDQVSGLLKKDRQLPSVDPENPTQATLTHFPSENIIKQGEEITKKVETESAAIRDAAVAMNKHVPLVPGAFPNPIPVAAIGFRNAYQEALPLNVPGGVLKSRFAQDLKAGMPPLATDITARQNELAADIKQKMLFINAQGQPTNQPAVDKAITEQAMALPKQMMDEVAASSRVYISPDTFEVYPRIAAAAGAPDPIDMYFAQLSYWIQQDVVAAVNDVNGQSKSVKDSIVKHLISVRCRSQGVPTFVIAADTLAQANGDPDGALPKSAAVSPTSRVCCGLYDVFHFTVVADVEADKISEFLRGLGDKRFITPLSCEVKAVDNASAISHGFIYGDKPVVNVTVECEVIYLRKWNLALMPQKIRERLGIPAEGAAPGAAPTPAAAPAAGTPTPAI